MGWGSNAMAGSCRGSIGGSGRRGIVAARVEQGGDGRQVGDVSWGHNGGSSMARVIRGDHGREVGTS